MSSSKWYILPILLSIYGSCLHAQEPLIKTRFVYAQGGETLRELLEYQAGIPKDVLEDEGYFKKIKKWNPSLENPTSLTTGERVYVEVPYRVVLGPQNLLSGEGLAVDEVSKDDPQLHGLIPKPKERSRGPSFIPGLNEWNTSLDFGGKYLAFDQKGSLLNSANVDVTFYNRTALYTEFIFEEWSALMELSTYKFKYSSLDQEDESRFNRFEVGASYKWFLASIESEESPLFKNNSGEVEMTKMNVVSLGIGAQKSFEIPSFSSTFFKLKGLIQVPLQAGADNAEAKIDSLSGVGAKTDAILTREIMARDNFSLDLTWTMGASYKQYSVESEWGSSVGDSDSSMTSFTGALGLVFSLR